MTFLLHKPPEQVRQDINQEFIITKDTSYIDHEVELWGVYCEGFEQIVIITKHFMIYTVPNLHCMPDPATINCGPVEQYSVVLL